MWNAGRQRCSVPEVLGSEVVNLSSSSISFSFPSSLLSFFLSSSLFLSSIFLLLLLNLFIYFCRFFPPLLFLSFIFFFRYPSICYFHPLHRPSTFGWHVWALRSDDPLLHRPSGYLFANWSFLVCYRQIFLPFFQLILRLFFSFCFFFSSVFFRSIYLSLSFSLLLSFSHSLFYID